MSDCQKFSLEGHPVNPRRVTINVAFDELLTVLKNEKLVLDWKKQQKTRAGVRQAIEKVLDQDLPRAYTPEIYERKCDVVYQHVFESYYGQGKSLYAVQ